MGFFFSFNKAAMIDVCKDNTYFLIGLIALWYDMFWSIQKMVFDSKLVLIIRCYLAYCVLNVSIWRELDYIVTYIKVFESKRIFSVIPYDTVIIFTTVLVLLYLYIIDDLLKVSDYLLVYKEMIDLHYKTK